MPRSLIAIAGLAILVIGMVIGRMQKRPLLYAGAAAFLQMTLFTLLGVVLSYGLAARGGALWDVHFGAADRALGFDWPLLFVAADRFPLALWLGGLAYHSLTLQMIAAIVALSTTGQVDRLRIAVTAAIASGFGTILISGAMPALGNVVDPAGYRHLWPSVAWLEQDMLLGLRDGSWRMIDLTRLMGIVTFPSYHATLPIILAWALANTRGWRVVAPVWAGITILATPLFGGHYAVDVLAGVGLAVLVLWLAPKVVRAAPRGALASIVRSTMAEPTATYAPRKVQSGADNALV